MIRVSVIPACSLPVLQQLKDNRFSYLHDFEPDPALFSTRHTAIGPMGGLLLALGLGAKEPGENMLTVDALIASLGQGRLADAALGRALIEAASSGAIKFARWSKQLARAAQAGPPQANAIFLAVEALFESGQGMEAADYSKLVELERELAHQTGLRLSRPGSIRTLEAIPTGGKTKRVIAELLSL